MTAILLVGDIHKRQAELTAAGEKFDLLITSPPFLALRSYLPDDHPQKHLEIGSEGTPAAYLDHLLALTAEWRKLLAPHGSIAVELGDTYAGSGGGGGDYYEDGLRAGQPGFTGSASASRDALRDGWPLDKSLCGIPTLYTWSLAYGRNLLTGAESPAGQWRIRNLKPWIRTNPPVGALGDKERPATSYITVATLARDRWFDLDAVRSQPTQDPATYTGNGYTKGSPQDVKGNEAMAGNPGGAPPLDWWHQTDATIDDELQQRARDSERPNSHPRENEKHARVKNMGGLDNMRPGARGWHIRRRLEKAGILPPHPDALDISPRGYSGAHYAVWPPELIRQLIDEMCPRRVCTTCGEPSRRIVGEATYVNNAGQPALMDMDRMKHRKADELIRHFETTGDNSAHRITSTVGWSDCGHNTWRPGRILDPFCGSGTTGAVASGMGRDCILIDLDERNADLARERIGMFLEVIEREAVT